MFDCTTEVATHTDLAGEQCYNSRVVALLWENEKSLGK